MRNVFPAHVLFPSGHLLPLGWLRLPLLIATLGLSCICLAVAAQVLLRSRKLEMTLKTKTQQTRTMIVFDMNDIRSINGVQDRQGAKKKYHSFDQLPIQCAPFSTRTLGLQTFMLSFLSVWIFTVCCPYSSTLFTWTCLAHLTIQGLDTCNLSLIIGSMYWDYGFL